MVFPNALFQRWGGSSKFEGPLAQRLVETIDLANTVGGRNIAPLILWRLARRPHREYHKTV